jgi:hypothetical protein
MAVGNGPMAVDKPRLISIAKYPANSSITHEAGDAGGI